MKVIFCVPTIAGPTEPFKAALEKSVPVIVAAGWEEGTVFEVGNPYISNARDNMIRKALDAGADVIVLLDHDVSWRPQDLLKLIETEGECVAGTYRFKQDTEEYMGEARNGPGNRPIVRADGAVRANCIPAGFMKLTRAAIERFARHYPHLLYGSPLSPTVDIFNHGAIEGIWYGEDYAFSKRFNEAGGEIWIVPDLDIDHHDAARFYPGNFHKFLLRQPGGSDDPARANT